MCIRDRLPGAMGFGQQAGGCSGNTELGYLVRLGFPVGPALSLIHISEPTRPY